jgi:hypothetical protein
LINQTLALKILEERKRVNQLYEKQSMSGGNQLPAVRQEKRALTAAEFQNLAAVPAEMEWFANIDNKRTRRAYQIDLREFMQFVGIRNPIEFRIVTRAHMIAWRKHLV